jgi:hypothetical protein
LKILSRAPEPQPTVAVATTVYAAGLIYFEEFCRGLLAAVDHYAGESIVVIVSDDVSRFEIEDVLAGFGGLGRAIISNANSSAVPQLRLQMLKSAANAGDLVVCFDMDDVPSPQSLMLHSETLRDADFSYGDMWLLDDTAGSPRTFFEGCAVPEIVRSPEALRNRNFVGLTNSAVRGEVLRCWDEGAPDVDAVDWWLYTRLLQRGCIGKKTRAPVVSYRIHDNSAVGTGPRNLDQLARHCRIIRRHFAALSQEQSSDAAMIASLAETIDSEPCRVDAAMAVTPSRGVWYERVFGMARTLSMQGSSA